MATPVSFLLCEFKHEQIVCLVASFSVRVLIRSFTERSAGIKVCLLHDLSQKIPLRACPKTHLVCVDRIVPVVGEETSNLRS